ncbi:ASB18 protein, partial [Anseranas semipalmata]|nr:ASB18 protein [Anseranas semipalmata]
MGELPGPVTEKLQISPKLDSEQPLTSLGSKYYTALLTGDLRSLEVLTDRYYKDVNLVFEISNDEMEWQVKSQASYGLSGLWSLEYKRELTTPLCIAAGRGHAACLRHLLHRRADPDLAPGGRAPLHEACRGGHAACVELLLEHKADPNLRSDEGLAPLHLCTTRDSLGCLGFVWLWGAWANPYFLWSSSLADSIREGHWCHSGCPLLKSRLSCHRHAGAELLAVLGEGFTLALCGFTLVYLGLSWFVSVYKARPPASAPFHLHQSCGAANAALARFLLRRGADVNAIDYDGVSPLGCALQAAAFKRELRPHLAVQLLLNHGSQKIWPPAFVKVLKSCAAVPEIIEILINSYSQIPVSENWAEAVPEEVMQQHQLFYESFFRLSGTVRCLQHLCRFAIRKKFGNKCHCLIPLLPVPKPLRDYLLLEPEG